MRSDNYRSENLSLKTLGAAYENLFAPLSNQVYGTRVAVLHCCFWSWRYSCADTPAAQGQRSPSGVSYISFLRTRLARRPPRIWAVCTGDRVTACAVSQDHTSRGREETNGQARHRPHSLFRGPPPPISESLLLRDGQGAPRWCRSVVEVDRGQLAGCSLCHL